jgi:two-component system chemotaxis response regulator CheB
MATGRDIIVIGGSAGALDPLQELLAELPPDLGATIFVVVHVGASTRTRLPEVLARAGKLPAKWAENGESFQRGHIYVAPPDHHLLLEDGRTRLVFGPKENHTRPAIDPLFRSSAIAYGPRTIGVVLSGMLDDGTAGFLAIKDRGGILMVQDPCEAYAPSMPESVLASVVVDHCLLVRNMAEILVRYDPPPFEVAVPVPALMEIEHKLTAMEMILADRRELERVGRTSAYACPECGGVLYQLRDERLIRFRCNQGHAWSVLSLLSALSESREQAMAEAARIASEEAELARQLAQSGPRKANTETLLANSNKFAQQVRELQRLLTAYPSGEDHGIMGVSRECNSAASLADQKVQPEAQALAVRRT